MPDEAGHATEPAEKSRLGDKQSAKEHLEAAYAILDGEMTHRAASIPYNQTEAARTLTKSALEVLAERDGLIVKDDR